MTVGVPKETFDLERRVSTTPESATKLVDAGFNVQVRKAGSVGIAYVECRSLRWQGWKLRGGVGLVQIFSFSAVVR